MKILVIIILLGVAGCAAGPAGIPREPTPVKYPETKYPEPL